MEKVKQVASAGGGGAFRRYRDIFYGDRSVAYIMMAEFVTALACSAHGAWGLFLRSKLYPGLFRKTGRKVVFGRNITLRHAHKITIGNNVIIDDNCVLDAKGTENEGITIGDNVYVGRGTSIACKNGNVRIGDNVNLSSYCSLMASNDLTFGPYSVIGAFSYFVSGGGYDYSPEAKLFSLQNGYITKGPLVIGRNCWLGARVTVLDNASIGDHSVVGAGAVVIRPIEPNSIALGVPAKVVKTIPPGPESHLP